MIFTNIYRKVFLFLGCYFVLFFLSAQTKKYSLEDCIKYALDKNINLKISKLNENLRSKETQTQRLKQLPDVDIYGNQNWNFGRSIDPTTNDFTTDAVRSNYFQIGTTWTLYSGGELRLQNQQKKITEKTAKVQTQKTKNDLILQILEGYITILYNKELSEVSHFQLDNTIEQAEQTELLIQAGKLPEATAYDLTAQKAEDELNVIEAEKNLKLSVLNMRRLMQFSEKDSLELETSNFDILSKNITLSSRSQIEKIAISTMPEIQEIKLQIESSKLETQIQKAKFQPTILTYASVQSNFSSRASEILQSEIQEVPIGYFYEGINRQTVFQEMPQNIHNPLIFNNQINRNLRQTIGFSCQFTLFDGTRSKLSETKIRQEQAELKAQEVEAKLRQKIQEAHANAQAVRKAFEVHKTKAEASESIFKVVLKKFQLGVTNAVEFALAGNKLRIARSELIRAKYQYLLTLKILDFYAGQIKVQK